MMTEYQFLIISQINVIKRIVDHQVSLSQLLRVSKYGSTDKTGGEL
jgi:hypothetical protein